MKYQKLIELFPTIQRDVSLDQFTTFKIGGPADCFIAIKNEKDLVNLINKVREFNIPYYILGGGSNLLINDNGFRGIVIKIENETFEKSGEKILVGAGVNLSWLVNKTKDLSLSGLEICAGIPGTVGGAIVGNAGSKDFWIDSVVEEVSIIDKDGNLKNIKRDDCEFAYRNSRFKKNGEVVTSVLLKLKNQNKEEIENKIKDFLERKKNQPSESSAGSVFKNPEDNSAGKLIEEAGLKGLKIGNAQVSEKHANFIINLGGATSFDVLKLIGLIKDKIQDKFGIELELEIKILNE